jgi:hypothetical protein
MELELNQNKIIDPLLHLPMRLLLPIPHMNSQPLLMSKAKTFLKLNRFLNLRKIVSTKG